MLKRTFRNINLHLWHRKNNWNNQKNIMILYIMVEFLVELKWNRYIYLSWYALHVFINQWSNPLLPNNMDIKGSAKILKKEIHYYLTLKRYNKSLSLPISSVLILKIKVFEGFNRYHWIQLLALVTKNL